MGFIQSPVTLSLYQECNNLIQIRVMQCIDRRLSEWVHDAVVLYVIFFKKVDLVSFLSS